MTPWFGENGALRRVDYPFEDPDGLARQADSYSCDQDTGFGLLSYLRDVTQRSDDNRDRVESFGDCSKDHDLLESTVTKAEYLEIKNAERDAIADNPELTPLRSVRHYELFGKYEDPNHLEYDQTRAAEYTTCEVISFS